MHTLTASVCISGIMQVAHNPLTKESRMFSLLIVSACLSVVPTMCATVRDLYRARV